MELSMVLWNLKHMEVKNNICRWLAHHVLPKRLVYFCAVYLVSHSSTTDEFVATCVGDIRAMEAINNFGKDMEIFK